MYDDISSEQGICCGLKEISGIYEEPIGEIKKHLEEYVPTASCAFIVFTEIKASPGVRDFVKDIRKHKVGAVHTLPRRRNPNTGNMVTMHVWTPNWNKYYRYVSEKGKASVPR